MQIYIITSRARKYKWRACQFEDIFSRAMYHLHAKKIPPRHVALLDATDTLEKQSCIK